MPAVVGCADATRLLHSDQEITVSCAEGDTGFVYEGTADYSVEELDLDHVPRNPHRSIMLNLANPHTAARWWRLPSAMVSAWREWSLSSRTQSASIPMALVNFDDDAR